MGSKKIAVIIVNWNGREHLSTCLRSLSAQRYDNFSVILVDNGSCDDSVKYVHDTFPAVTILEQKMNLGFAEGNNVGIRHALRDPSVRYVATLNNDTEVAPGWLAELVHAVKSDARIGAACSKMMFFQKRNVVDSAGDFLLPGTMKVVTRGYGEDDRGQYDQVEECFSARAGAALYRREMLEDTQLAGDYFDSRYFAYVEDTDLSIRARLRGWHVVYAPGAVVYHKVAATSSKLSYVFRRYHSGRNRILTALKDYPPSLWIKSLRGTDSIDRDYRLPLGQAILTYLRIVRSVVALLPRTVRQRKYIQSRRTVSMAEVRSWPRCFELPTAAR
ncbi:MAG: glycosyltransferase family 2 protein [Patescibacteria group bacterium]